MYRLQHAFRFAWLFLQVLPCLSTTHDDKALLPPEANLAAEFRSAKDQSFNSVDKPGDTPFYFLSDPRSRLFYFLTVQEGDETCPV